MTRSQHAHSLASHLEAASHETKVTAEPRDFGSVSGSRVRAQRTRHGAITAACLNARDNARRVLRVVLATLALVPAGIAFSTGAAHASDTASDAAQGHPLADHLGTAYRTDLDGILERRYLRVLTSHGAFDYYLDGGRPRGFQYEMVKAFVRQLNKRHPAPKGQPPIEFEILPVADGELIPMLLSGRGDMVAARLTRTEGRDTAVEFSQPYRTVDEVVVQRRNGPAIENLRDLSGETIAVRRSSSYYESIVDQNRKLKAEGRPPIRVQTVDDDLTTERILSLVAQGAIERTVADSMVAEAVAAAYPELQVLSSVRLRENGALAWVVPLGSKALLAEIDRFLPRYEEGSLHGNLALQAYFGDLHPIQKHLAAGDETTISPFDDTFRELADDYGFDWRLVAAVAWQESRFDQSATNRSGATGVFQIKPQTAAEPYVGIPNVKGKKNARNNIHAGIKYLAWIKGRYFDPVEEMDEKDRVRMMLAAYNAGPRHVLRARRKAAEMGLDPNRWFRNVELGMLALRKREPVRYVSQINQSYVAYLMLGYE